MTEFVYVNVTNTGSDPEFSQAFQYDDASRIWVALTSPSLPWGAGEYKFAHGSDLLFLHGKDNATYTATVPTWVCWERVGTAWAELCRDNITTWPVGGDVTKTQPETFIDTDWAGNMIVSAARSGHTGGRHYGIHWWTRSGNVVSYGGMIEDSYGAANNALEFPSVSPDGRWMVASRRWMGAPVLGVIPGDQVFVWEWTGTAWVARAQLELGLTFASGISMGGYAEWRPDSGGFIIPLSAGNEPYRAFFLSGADQFVMAPGPNWVVTFGYVAGTFTGSRRGAAWSPDGNYVAIAGLSDAAKLGGGTYKPLRIFTAGPAGWNQIAVEPNDPAVSFTALHNADTFNAVGWEAGGSGIFVAVAGTSSNSTDKLGTFRFAGGNNIVSMDLTEGAQTGKPAASGLQRLQIGNALVADVGGTPVRNVQLPEFRYTYRWPELIEQWGGTDEEWDKVNEEFSYDESTGTFHGR